MVTSPVPAPRRRRMRLAGLALAVTLPLACEGSTSEPDRVTIHFQTLAKASVTTNSPARVREVVRDPARYAAVWRELWGDREVARPAVDFGREMVIAITHPIDACLGEVEIDRVERAGAGFVVKAGESVPHLCSCVIGETTFHVVKGPRLPDPIGFETHAIPSRCG